jgi:hypothetical protein
MDFVTIHDLSRELDVSARVVRYHLMRLITVQKLKKDEDYRQEDFKDPLHFEWKINPLSFMRESGLKPKSPIPKIADEPIIVDNNLDNQPLPKPMEPVNETPPIVTKPLPAVNDSVDQTGEIISLHREMITAFKEQIHVKDEQIRELTKQNRDAGELNLKLNSALLKQGDEIKNLLQLTGGKMEFGSVVNQNVSAVNKTVNQASTIDNSFVDQTNDEGSPPVAMAA